VAVIQQLSAGSAAVFMLTLARISGLFVVAPVFSSKLIPVRAKLLVALALTLAAAPLAGHVPAATGTATLVVLMLKEVLVGAALAFVVAVVFAAIAFAGSLIDLQSGFAFANVVDPLQNTQISVIGQVYSLLASAVFVSIDGPGLLLAGVVRSFDVVPVTAMPAFSRMSGAIAGSLAGLFAVGLQVAAPIVVTLLVTDIAIGFLARIAPQMNIFGIELPAKIVAVFVLLLVTAPLLISSMSSQLANSFDRMFTMLLGGTV
jgi:flagellar biosynthesis protein FliR